MSAETDRSKAGIPKLADVARQAGVSTATVSRCLNDPSVVSERTRQKVMKAVERLGYAPNFGAQALAAKRTNTFGAIIPTMENAIFARGLQAFQEELGAHRTTLLVASSSYRPDLEEEQIRALVARGADALLLIGYDRTEATYEFLRQRNMPFVVSWAFDAGHSATTVGFDNRQAMQTLAAQVIDLGHRRLALISAERRDNDRARERVAGVLAAMADTGLAPDDLTIVEVPYSIENGSSAFAQLMARADPPTAVLCGNDVLAAGALTQAKAMGLSVPDDVSITGFDDIELAQIVDPPLTTVHVPHRDMGREAARTLIAARNGTEKVSSLKLQTQLVWRQSLGPAPKTG
ncbi:MAG: LacI family DNA-binding transcriptional regulator [Pseudomonadota bacterium]